MSSTTSRRPARPRLVIPGTKAVESATFRPVQALASGNLSPNLQPVTPPFAAPSSQNKVLSIGKYLLLEALDSSSYRAWHVDTMEEYVCKVFQLSSYRAKLAPYFRLDAHANIGDVKEIICGEKTAYAIFGNHFGDLHTYVKNKRRLTEDEGKRLFAQIAAAVAHCHAGGVVIRDLKLRKFVFADAGKTLIKLDGLDSGARVLEADSPDDTFLDMPHACPPGYVSPEILAVSTATVSLAARSACAFALPACGSSSSSSSGPAAGGVGYSGKAADVWSLGVMLYSMLTGRYPFQEADAGRQFYRIWTGSFTVPDSLSYNARCLIRSLLRQHAAQRLDAADIAYHPWLRSPESCAAAVGGGSASSRCLSSRAATGLLLGGDQCVPSAEPLCFAGRHATPKAMVAGAHRGSEEEEEVVAGQQVTHEVVV